MEGSGTSITSSSASSGNLIDFDPPPYNPPVASQPRPAPQPVPMPMAVAAAALPQAQVIQPSTSPNPSGHRMTNKMGMYARYYEKMLQGIPLNSDGKLEGRDAVTTWAGSGLSRDVLKSIWDAADIGTVR